MSGKRNKKGGEGTHARGGGGSSSSSSSSKRPGANSDSSKGRRHKKKTKRNDNTTNNTGRSTRARSAVDDSTAVATVPKALQDFNKTSRKENKEKEGTTK